MSKKSSDDNWVENLWAWAEQHKISKKTLPRNQSKLLNIKCLDLMMVYFGIEKKIKKQYSRDKLLLLSEEERVDDLNFQLIKGQFPEEIGKLTQLDTLCISHNFIERLPISIVNLKNLKRLCLCHNKDLVLSFEQKLWIWELDKNGSIIECDEHLNLFL